MGIRSKFFLIKGPLMIAVVFFVYTVVSDRFLKQFTNIELDLVEQDIDRTFDAVNASVNDIDAKIIDWAQWDATYVFMQDHNTNYWQSNLSNDDVLRDMRLSGMVFVDTSDTVVASKNIFDNNPSSDVLPPDIAQELLGSTIISVDRNRAHKGIVCIQNQYFLFASQPIMQTNSSGPSMGTLIFIRLLDDALVQELSTRTHLSLRFYASINELNLDSSQKDYLLSNDNDRMSIVAVKGTVMAGYGVTYGFADKNPLFVRIEMPRIIYNQGQTIVNFFSIFIAITFIVFAILIIALLEWLIFSPLSRLNDDVIRIRKNAHSKMHIPVRRNDQFARLSTTINGMLDGLYALEEKNKESENRFRAIADLAPILIRIAGVDKKCNYFNKAWLEFTGRTMQQEMGDGWLDGIHPDDINICVHTYNNAFDTRKPFRMEYRLKHKSGEYRWILDNAVPNFSSHTSFLGYLGSCIDTTEWKNIQKEQTEKMQELEMLNKMMVSRELRMIELKDEIKKLKG